MAEEPLADAGADDEPVDPKPVDGAIDGDDDVEGHRYHGAFTPTEDDDDDVEGHRFHGA